MLEVMKYGQKETLSFLLFIRLLMRCLGASGPTELLEATWPETILQSIEEEVFNGAQQHLFRWASC